MVMSAAFFIKETERDRNIFSVMDLLVSESDLEYILLFRIL